MNKEIRQLEQQNMDAVTRMSELQLKKENLYKQRNSITDSFFKRIFQRNKLKQLDSEIKDTFNEQENYMFEISDINLEMESLILQEKLDNNIREATERLEVEGLYLSSPIYSPETIRDETNIIIETDDYIQMEFKHIPSAEDIIKFASENDVITQVNKDDMVKLKRELNKADLQLDGFPYSYSTYVSNVYDNGETPYVRVYDDTDASFTDLFYDSEENKWESDYYSLSVDNPSDSVKEKYSQSMSTKTTSERLANVLQGESISNRKIELKDLKQIAEQRVQENKNQLENSFEENYGNFLKHGFISKREKNEIMHFDNNQSDFDKVSRRLEVLEKVKQTNPRLDLTQKERELSAIKGNDGLRNNVVSREYTQMNREDQQRRQIMKNINQQQALER